MKKIIFLSLTILFFAGSIESQTVIKEQPVPFPSKSGLTIINNKPIKDTIIKWKDTRKLTWDDFIGKTPVPTPYKAASCIELMWKPQRINGKVNFNIYAGFNTKSYTTTNSTYVLEHEQLHFDLCEVYARMLKKYVLETDNIFESTDKGDMMNHYFLSLREMVKSEGARYDIETRHGLDKTKQQEWEKYITDKLKEFEKYK